MTSPLNIFKLLLNSVNSTETTNAQKITNGAHFKDELREGGIAPQLSQKDYENFSPKILTQQLRCFSEFIIYYLTYYDVGLKQAIPIKRNQNFIIFVFVLFRWNEFGKLIAATCVKPHSTWLHLWQLDDKFLLT